MLSSCLVALLMCFHLLAEAPATTPTVDRAAPLASFVGEWTIDAKWAAGEELHARNVYTWGVGEKHLKAQTFVKLPDGKEYQRYDTVMGWNPRLRCYSIYGFGFDGNVTEHRMDVSEDGKVFKIGFAPLHAGEESPIRQTITLSKDNDSFEWVVEANMQGEWKELMRGTWVKKP